MHRAKYINIARTHNRRHPRQFMKPWIALLILLLAFFVAGLNIN